MEEKQPFVSIVIPVYNTGRYVIYTLESILKQAYPLDRIQVIVIDDASTDNSVEIVRNWLHEKQDFNCVFEINEANLGLNKTLNKAIKSFVKHEYLILIGDDVILNNRISIQVATLQNNPTSGFCFSDMEVIDAQGNLITNSFLLSFYNIDPNEFQLTDLYERLLSGNIVPAPSIMHKTSIIREMEYFDEDLTFEDYDMNLRILKKYAVSFIPSSLVQYRKIGNTMSNEIYVNLKHIKTYFLIFQKQLDSINSKSYVIKRMNWFLEKLYLEQKTNSLSYTFHYLENYCTDELLKNCILKNKPKLYYRIRRKLRKIGLF